MELIKKLARILPKSSIIDDPIAKTAFECDGLSAYKQIPLVVVLPENIQQIQDIIKLCQLEKVPIVTRGAGTGLSAGALPLKNSLVLGLSKLNKILDIDPLNKSITVEPGVRNISVSQAVTQHNLFYAPDPSSQIACTIGGNIAENSGGVHCLKYGLTVHNVLQIKYLNSDAELVTLDYHDDLGLLALLNGSEGLLGIIVEATLKLTAKPKHTQLIMAGFQSSDACVNSVAEILKAGVIPSGLEMMDALTIEAVNKFIDIEYPKDCEALLLCELDGDQESVELELTKVTNLLEKYQSSSITVAKNEAERLALWKGRKSAFPAVGSLSPDYYCMDGTIPKNQLSKVLAEIKLRSDHYKLKIANVFHAGDGNLHPLILYNAGIDGELEKTERLGAEILQICVDAGGTITGEHGVGIEKIDSMCSQFNSNELSQMHAIKAVFDENNLLNPGKAVPTLHRCAELGSMHVHNNKLPFPELDRF